eukprot:359235-Hanusia_phi.AAC.1
MEWGSDALKIYFAHMKNDKNGERPRDACHVYANTVSPAICPILALGKYRSIFVMDHASVTTASCLQGAISLNVFANCSVTRWLKTGA